ncbi:MAG TPA: BatA domain-containing protein, partial [Candidatus Binataceae bacterium]|nr:BatA domain-containing protein [Candidatus Binataceae bacterium]
MGLLNPNHLLWGISIAVLLTIYLRSRSRPTIEVSSLLLFDEAAAPAVRVRHLRIDPLFWLEMAMLAALTLALGGLYVRTTHAAAQGRNRALVFDLAAGMAAREGSGTRLDLAKQQALALVNSASERDRFSVIGYALEGEMIHAETANRDAIRAAISGLHPMAVPTRRAAQSSALMRARAAGDVEFFSDRRPPDSIINDSGLSSAFHFHQSGAPAENLAIVSLDPGLPLNSRGRAVLKNFGPKPQTCELAID